jgi:hypothetical protein
MEIESYGDRELWRYGAMKIGSYGYRELWR